MANPSGRLLELLSLLQARRDWPGAALARRLEVSPRTVRRDVDRLRDLGYPVQTTKGPAGGYRLAPGLDLPPLLFDDDQAVALAVALQIASSDLAGLETDAQRALATIRQVLPTRLRHRVAALEVTSLNSRPDAGEAGTDMSTLLQVGSCCRDHEVLRFDYITRDGETSVRRTEPHRVISRGRRWYLLGWDLDRAAWRTYRLDRITPRTPNGPRFRPRPVPDDLVEHLFGPDRDAARWPLVGTFLLHAPAADVGRWVGAGRGTVSAVDDHTCRLEVGGWSHGSLLAFVLLFEVDFEVLGPPELADALTDVQDRLLRAGRPRPASR